MGSVGDYVLLVLKQFAGGPGPVENNLVRFGLAAILWACPVHRLLVTPTFPGSVTREAAGMGIWVSVYP